MTYSIEQQLADTGKAWKALAKRIEANVKEMDLDTSSECNEAMLMLGQAEVARFRATGEDVALSYDPTTRNTIRRVI